MRTKKRIRLKGRLRIYMQTSLYMGILLLIVDIGTYFLDVRAGFLLTCFLLFYFGMIILLMFYNRPIILNELISFATQYRQSRGSGCRRASRRRKSRSPLKRAIISRILRGYRCGG